MNQTSAPSIRAKSKLPAAVIALGFASFFNDIGSEMVFPLLPVFLVSLGAGPTYLGIVEGVADATASVFKYVAGYLADRLPRSKPLVVFGYALPCSVRPLLSLATGPLHVLAIRVTDRIGKGLRTAPRDSLIASAVSNEEAGRAFGFHRAMDHAGAALGPLLATLLLLLGFTIRQVFLVAIVPSVLALVAVAWVREVPRAKRSTIAGESAPARAKLPGSFPSYLAIIALFALANSSDAFLLLRANEIGVPTATLPLLWAVLNFSRVGCTVVGGRLADRFSRVRLIAAGWFIFALCYVSLGFANDVWMVWPLFAIYGLHNGLCEPAERALIRDLAPESARGRAFGLFHGVVGACAIPAGLWMGWIWEAWSARSALSIAAAVALIAAAALVLWERNRVPGNPPASIAGA